MTIWKPFVAICLMSSLLLSACNQEKPKPKQNNRDLLVKSDQPIAFKKRTLGFIKRPKDLSIYVCDGIEFQLQDRIMLHKEYSAEFIKKILSELPESLQNVYATCYVENELKEISFKDYYEINKGFLGPEAIKGYIFFDAVDQERILTKFFELIAKKPKTDKEQKELWAKFKKLDQLWKNQDKQALHNHRGEYARKQFDQKAWPLKEQ